MFFLFSYTEVIVLIKPQISGVQYITQSAECAQLNYFQTNKKKKIKHLIIYLLLITGNNLMRLMLNKKTKCIRQQN